MAIWINTGTISISAGGTTVTGSGTSFLTGGAQKGDMFQAPDGREYEITNIVSDTQLSIYKAYQGTTVSGSTNWDIIPTQGYVKALVDEVREYVETNNTIVEEISTTGLSIAHGGTGATTASGARTNLGLGNVDNTSDANKPVSTAQQTALNGKLGISATAADSAKLGGVTPDGYIKKTDINGLVGNLSAPLTHLPLKKNLLTAQGQSICTFTRASVATYTDRYGTLKTAAADIPRFTADGLLVEGASTNSLLYSEQFDNAAWVKAGATVTANTTATTDPYGTNLAEKLTEDTSTGNHRVYQVFTTTAGSTTTRSVLLKAGERSRCYLHGYNGSVNKGAYFDLAVGTVISAESGVTADIRALANGWYRCAVTMTETVTSERLQIQLINSGTTINYTGDGTSGLYIFGAQFEAMPFATSYIPTTATAATRAYNNFSLPQAENTPLYTGDFSIFADVTPSGVLSTQYLIGDANLASGIKFYIDETGDIKFFLNGITIGASTTVSVSDTYRVCIIKQGMSIQIYLNGELRNSNNLPAVPANQTNLYIGSRNGTSGHYFGQINNLRIYDRALTAEEVYAA